MNDYALALAIAYAIAPVLPGVNVHAHDVRLAPGFTPGTFVPDTGAELVLPAVGVTSVSEPLVGSRHHARSKVEITIESHLDDDSSQTHSERVTAVANVLADMAALDAAAETAGGEIGFCGRPCPTDTDPSVEQRAYVTTITYRVGYAI